MEKKSGVKIFLAAVLPAIVVLFVIFFVVMPKVRESGEQDQKPAETVNTEKDDLIRVGFPHPNQTVKSPFTATGEARGTWFFEASFPVEVVGDDGSHLTVGIAQAQSEWMTEDFVPWRADISIPGSYSGRATLIFRKDNPSGLPEFDDALEIPVIFE